MSLAAEARYLGLHYGMRLLPTEACSALGARLGLSVGRAGHPLSDSRAQAVLRHLRPQADPLALEASLTRLWRNVGRSYAEFSVLRRIVREGRVGVAAPEILRAAATDPRPLILCFLHIGNWEVLGEQMARLWPWKITAVVMPPKDRAQALIARRRHLHLPAHFLEMDRHIWRAAAARLREPGGVLWLAADESHEGRVYAPFFGRAPTLEGNLGKMVRLASTTGARILPIYAERQPGVRFVIHALPELGVFCDRRDTAALLHHVGLLDALLAPVVRQLAEQWFMALSFGDRLDAPAPVAEAGAA